jgi:acetolactate synthase small subunit
MTERYVLNDNTQIVDRIISSLTEMIDVYKISPYSEMDISANQSFTEKVVAIISRKIILIKRNKNDGDAVYDIFQDMNNELLQTQKDYASYSSAGNTSARKSYEINKILKQVQDLVFDVRVSIIRQSDNSYDLASKDFLDIWSVHIATLSSCIHELLPEVFEKLPPKEANLKIKTMLKILDNFMRKFNTERRKNFKPSLDLKKEIPILFDEIMSVPCRKISKNNYKPRRNVNLHKAAEFEDALSRFFVAILSETGEGNGTYH